MCGGEPEDREEVVIKDSGKSLGPTKESQLLYLAWLAEGRRRGLWPVFYLEFSELELKGTLGGLQSCPPLCLTREDKALQRFC